MAVDTVLPIAQCSNSYAELRLKGGLEVLRSLKGNIALRHLFGFCFRRACARFFALSVRSLNSLIYFGINLVFSLRIKAIIV